MSLRFILLLVCMAFIYLLANGSVPLWDRDEPRYAQTSKQMLESGDWVFPKLLDQPRLAKPIFIYWCQAASMKVFGTTHFAARFPSVIAAILTLLLIHWAISREVGSSHALWTTFIFATSALTIIAAKMSITDAVLTLFITLAQWCVYQLWRGNWSWRTVLLLGLAIGFAGLTKGPVVLGVIAMSLLVLAILRRFSSDDNAVAAAVPSRSSDAPSQRRLRTAATTYVALKLLVVLTLIVMVVAPWIIAMERRIPGYLADTLYSQVFERIKTPQEGHKGPPGYYLFTVWGTFFPWSLLLPAAMVQGWRNRKDPAIRFALAAIIGPWILFECVATKLPHYVLPTFPFIAFLTADMLIRAARKEHPDITSDAFVKLVRIWGGVVFVLACAFWILVPMFPPIPTRAIVSLLLLTLTAAVYGRVVLRFFKKRQVFHGAFALGAGWLILFALIYGGFLPAAWFLHISPRVADVLNREMKPNDRALMIDYKETSLPFYQGGTIRPERRANYLEAEDPTRWPSYLVLTLDVWRKVPPTLQHHWTPLAKIRGLSYADGGRIVEVLVLKKNQNSSGLSK